jgi:hypothetical protein
VKFFEGITAHKEKIHTANGAQAVVEEAANIANEAIIDNAEEDTQCNLFFVSTMSTFPLLLISLALPLLDPPHQIAHAFKYFDPASGDEFPSH